MKRNNLALGAVLLCCLAFLVLLILSGAGQISQEAQLQPGTVRISEICTKNETVIADNSGKYRDYIELYNAGNSRLDLAGFVLTDGNVRSKPLERFSLGAGEYKILFLSDETTGFALKASGGECIQLLDSAGNLVTQANTTALAPDQVMSYYDRGFTLTMDATPGFPNDASGRAAFVSGSPDTAPKLQLSEVLVGNVSSLPDSEGRFSDVVELYNASDEPIELGGFFLSDSLKNRFRYRLPEKSLAPGDYLVLYCDSQNRQETDGTLHLNFALSYGETLVLTAPDGRYTALDITAMGSDVSLALLSDGSYGPLAPSPGFPNTEEGAALFAQTRRDPSGPLVISEVLLSGAGVPYEGVFADVVELCNRSQQTLDTAGWYLSDGGDPYAYPLPSKQLKPGERLVIPCTPETTGFGLSRGEVLRLMGPDFTYTSQVDCQEPQPFQSLYPLEEGSISGPVTLGFEDTQAGAAAFAAQGTVSLAISEVMSDNTAYIKGPYGRTSDWVELYNATGETIELSDYCLSDDDGNLQACPLPAQTLAPGERVVYLLSADTVQLCKGYQVLSFALSETGDCLYLTKSGRIVDYVNIPALPLNMSYGRPEGSTAFDILESPTPGAANTAAAAITPDPIAVTPQGCYDGVDYVDVVLEGEGTIYYTTDCNRPSTYSKQYTGPIRLEKTTVLRVMCQAEGKRSSQVVDLSYIINENDTLSVVSVVTPPNNLWSEERGMYVRGPETDSPFPHQDANYFQNWEYAATVTLFETDGTLGFSEPCGIRMFGAFSRAYPKKSIACMFRGKYGASQLEYPLFGQEGLDQYEAFVLRSAGQDAFMARMRDVLITSIASEYLDLPVQKYRPVVVYLDGKYYGLHYIREKINEHYVAGNFNTDPEGVKVHFYKSWNDAEYRHVLEYAMQNDMSQQASYDYICSLVDIDNYIDYNIAQLWIANEDLQNVKYFKTPEGKWTWILYDTDLSFLHPRNNVLKNHLSDRSLGASDVTGKTLAVVLLENPQYREKFLTRMGWQCSNVWTEENILARIDALEATIQPDMVKDLKRWNTSYAGWQSYVEDLRTFAKTRNTYFCQHVKDFFDLTDEQMRAYGFPV